MMRYILSPMPRPTSSIVPILHNLKFGFLLFAVSLAFAEPESATQPPTPLPSTSDRALASEVSIIEIGSYLGSITQLTITRSSDHGFVRNGRCLGRSANFGMTAPRQPTNDCPEKDAPVSDEFVAALLRALREPRVEKPSLATAGIDQAWLDELARRECAGESKAGHCSYGSPKQKALYMRSLTDLEHAQKFFANIFHTSHTDDNPLVEIVIHLANGNRIEFKSESNLALLLPWKIDGSDNYNGRISRALADLMPAKACNRSRLNGEALQRELAEAASTSIEDKWNEIAAEEEVGPAIERLSAQYETSKAEVNEYRSFDYGDEYGRERNLHVTLRQAEWPANFELHLTLPNSAAGVEGVNDFLSRAPTYVRRLLAHTWLCDFFKQHPEQRLVLRYVNDASLGEKALRVFEADMQAVGRSELASEVSSHRREIVCFAAFNGPPESHWLLMPDGRLILWRYESSLPILNWKPESFIAGKCAGYPSFIGGCPGAVVSPDGKLVDDMLRAPLEICMTAEARAQLTIAQAERKGKHDPLFTIRRMNGGRNFIEGYEGYIDKTGRVVWEEKLSLSVVSPPLP
jgi:hypothetical protein